MIPVGYMAKRVVVRPECLSAEGVASIYSVSDCVNDNFADYIRFWRHNGYWFFDTPEIILEIARENRIELAGTMLFYYEVYEWQFDSGQWMPFEPERSFRTNVRVPEEKNLEGYDVVAFNAQTSPEHSPLSCQALASEIETNERCLLHSCERARALLENGSFEDCEPGPYRVFAVYSVAWPGIL